LIILGHFANNPSVFNISFEKHIKRIKESKLITIIEAGVRRFKRQV
jgi:hypothetical protein